MGQLPPMNEMFWSLGIGLGAAVFVIFVLLTAYFQSPRLALISISAAPGVIAGIVTVLYFTGTSLNIESFMGSIMCLGVSVSNSVMLVTFMDEHWKAGIPREQGGHQGRERTAPTDPDDRLRDVDRHGSDGPGPGKGEPDAGASGPSGHRRTGDVDLRDLARVPSIFAVVIGNRKFQSASIYPDDPESVHYDPEAYRKSKPRDTTARMATTAITDNPTDHQKAPARSGPNGSSPGLPRPSSRSRPPQVTTRSEIPDAIRIRR